MQTLAYTIMKQWLLCFLLTIILYNTMNNPKTPLFFITGTSGSGKTTLTQQLKHILPSQSFAIYDFDENGVPENADQAWRITTTLNWLIKAKQNYLDHKITIICGVSVPTEVNNLINSNNLPFIPHFGFIKIDDTTIRNRLKDRGWSEQSIDDNINWAQHLETDVARQKSHLIIDCSMSCSSENTATEFSTWIKYIVQNFD